MHSKLPFRLALISTICLFLGFTPPRARAFVIDSLDGDITANEINQFITSVSAMTINTNNYGNNMSDHQGGVTVEGISRLYEATNDKRLLDLLIKWNEVFMSRRNDLPKGEHRVMWDGRVEPTWPSHAPTDQYPGYAGCENDQVAGHIANCAWHILRRPALWNTRVPDGNPNGFGITYKQRAVKWIQLLDAGQAAYYTKWFVNSRTHKIQEVSDPRWDPASGGENTTAWNRQMMFIVAYQWLAQCHDILGDHPSFLPLYKDVVKQFGNGFVAGQTPYVVNGHNVCKWFYFPPPDTHIENIGHAQHDVVGLFQAYASRYTNVTAAQMQVYADTTLYVINLGATNSWSGNVDGTGTATTSLKTDFIFLSEFDRSLYKMIGQSNIEANQVNGGSERAKNTGYILYMKHWMFTH